MARSSNHLVIMAGGVGSRFWPMSTAENPKQFIDVLGVGKSLLQLTVERFGNLVAPVVVIQHHVLPTSAGESRPMILRQILW